MGEKKKSEKQQSRKPEEAQEAKKKVNNPTYGHGSHMSLQRPVHNRFQNLQKRKIDSFFSFKIFSATHENQMNIRCSINISSILPIKWINICVIFVWNINDTEEMNLYMQSKRSKVKFILETAPIMIQFLEKQVKGVDIYPKLIWDVKGAWMSRIGNISLFYQVRNFTNGWLSEQSSL